LGSDANACGKPAKMVESTVNDEGFEWGLCVWQVLTQLRHLGHLQRPENALTMMTEEE
jgi:hypothetical protein